MGLDDEFGDGDLGPPRRLRSCPAPVMTVMQSLLLVALLIHRRISVAAGTFRMFPRRSLPLKRH